MRFVKLALISVVIIFLLLTAIGSLFPSDILVSRAIDISQPADSIKKFIDNYDEWNNWMDGAMNSDLKVVAKDSVHAYFGIVMITLTNRKNYVWKHEWKTKTTIQNSTIHIIPQQNKCTVQWQFVQHVNWYPWEKIGSLMNDKIIGSSLENSLANLKMLAEKN